MMSAINMTMKRVAAGLAAMLLMSIAIAARADTVEYIHTDALGTPIAVTNASGAVIQTSEYAPYGQLLNRSVTDGPGYTGHVEDAATGLTYMQQRYYDPQIGRMLSVDPITADSGGHFNRYWYAEGNSYKFTDPDGRRPRPGGPGGSASHGLVYMEFDNAELVTSASEDANYSSSSSSDNTSENSSPGSPRADGKIPVPGVVGWKTGQYDMLRTPEQLDSSGKLIVGAAVVGAAAITADLSAPYIISAAGALRSTWKNLSFDGPSPGGMHANGRLFGVRWKGGQWGARLDLHPINSGKTPILHINFGPAARGEAMHVVLFDPRWLSDKEIK